ncbi:arylamine N-acetyltransferase [Paraburkholderia sp. GAS41]|uniref:arylamine N-acetyltransferase n=1 Tax=Paraburkholderia sp. GAS41 TaxID=3035134 RepID=UPI003D1AA054
MADPNQHPNSPRIQKVTWLNGPVEPSFKFSTEPPQLSDFNEMCIFHQTSDRSHFTRKEVCPRASSTRRTTRRHPTDRDRRWVA